MAECIQITSVNQLGTNYLSHNKTYPDNCVGMYLEKAEFDALAASGEPSTVHEINPDSTYFDTELYDFAYEGILSSWAIGIGIGLVLGMIAKLKR